MLPKATNPARIEESFELLDLQLEPDDVEKIDALDEGEAGRIGANPDAFASSRPMPCSRPATEPAGS